MSIQFSGVTRLTGERPAMMAEVEKIQKSKPLAIYGNVSARDVIVLDGQDSVYFLKAKLDIHLGDEELAWLDAGKFDQIKNEEKYIQMLEDLQGCASDAEEAPWAEEAEVFEPDEIVLLGDIMKRYYDTRKAAEGKARDGSAVLDKTV